MMALVVVFAGYFLSVSIKQSGDQPGWWVALPFQSHECLKTKKWDRGPVKAGMAEIAARTDATTEAWALALKNAFVFINCDRADAARRTYGCLYGLTTDGRLTFPYVPSKVSIWSLVQIIASSVLLFLFLLAVRNLLKLK